MMSSIAVLVNPVSGGGRGKVVWDELHPGLRAMFKTVTCRITNHHDDISLMVQGMQETHPDILLVIGGDGTLHHAINGFVEAGASSHRRTKLAYFNAGCGGDFAKLFPKQTITRFLESLKIQQPFMINIGKITLQNNKIRYFINVASCGFSALVAKSALRNRWLRKLGGTFHYLVNAILTLCRFKLSPVSIVIDDKPALQSKSLAIALCNGQYFGGAMHIAPMAKVDDGLLDVVVIEDISRYQVVISFLKLYSGKHIRNSHVHYVQGNKIHIDSLHSDPVYIEGDGEWIGALPATFELLPNLLAIIV